MALSSVFVLAALTATGLFIRGKDEDKSDGYVVDFSSMEENAKELAQGENAAPAGQKKDMPETMDNAVTSDDLDYDPYYQETNSANVENEENAENTENGETPEGKTDAEEGMIDGTQESADSGAEDGMSEEVAAMAEMEDTMAIATSTSIQPALTFGDGDTLAWPIVGNVLVNYSMDKTVYFPTLEQYKYNPAIIIAAVEGETITAAANGKVSSIMQDRELGNVVVMELGNGYELTYGQLKDITVSEGGFVSQGEIIGSVAAPTKYFSVEGCNVYFKLTKDGVPVNPMTKLK